MSNCEINVFTSRHRKFDLTWYFTERCSPMCKIVIFVIVIVRSAVSPTYSPAFSLGLPVSRGSRISAQEVPISSVCRANRPERSLHFTFVTFALAKNGPVLKCADPRRTYCAMSLPQRGESRKKNSERLLFPVPGRIIIIIIIIITCELVDCIVQKSLSLYKAKNDIM